MTAIQRLLGESGDWSFTTTIDDIDLSIEPRTFFSRGQAVISWTIDPDVREWGIKDITPSVTDFRVSVVEESYDEPNDRDLEFKREFTKKDFEGYEIVVEFQGTHPDDRGLGLSIVPRHLSIDYRRRKITVLF